MTGTTPSQWLRGTQCCDVMIEGRIVELLAENERLRARVAELERELEEGAAHEPDCGTPFPPNFSCEVEAAITEVGEFVPSCPREEP